MIDDDFDDSDDALGNRLKVLRSSHLLRHLCWQLGRRLHPHSYLDHHGGCSWSKQISWEISAGFDKDRWGTTLTFTQLIWSMKAIIVILPPVMMIMLMAMMVMMIMVKFDKVWILQIQVGQQRLEDTKSGGCHLYRGRYHKIICHIFLGGIFSIQALIRLKIFSVSMTKHFWLIGVIIITFEKQKLDLYQSFERQPWQIANTKDVSQWIKLWNAKTFLIHDI